MVNFVAGDFWAVPVNSISGTISSNTKVGLGALYDGVPNGPSNPPPTYDIDSYLTDGIKGLNIGTCIANLPSGSMTFLVGNIQPATIGDGIPDILVTQVADPSGGSFDRYRFTDDQGNQVGNHKDIVFTSINPIGNWIADFYEAKNNPLTLQPGFTRTERPIRLWAIDISAFGITSANNNSIKYFRIDLCGNSDVAFVAYNNKSVNVQSILPVKFVSFAGVRTRHLTRLAWSTASENNSGLYVVEKSFDGINFNEVGSVAANSANHKGRYEFIDNNPLSGNTWYRIVRREALKPAVFSSTITVNESDETVVSVFPNPARSILHISHPAFHQSVDLLVYKQPGILVRRQSVRSNTKSTVLLLSGLEAGIYYLQIAGGKTVSFLVQH